MVEGHAPDPSLARSTVALYWGQDSRCTAVIVHKRALLTAAHCARFRPQNMTAVVFTDDIGALLRKQKTADVMRVVDTHVHPAFGNDGGYSDDLAILVLEKDIPDGYTVARLPDGEMNFAFGASITSLGFGLMNRNGISALDKEIKLLQKNFILGQTPVEKLAFHRLWFKQYDGGICQGDSGGPVFQDAGAGPVVVGINGANYVTTGVGICAQEGYATRVDTSLDWIKQQLSEIAD